MNIYIAGPFSHDTERQALQEMINIVKARFSEHNLYVPMEYKVPGDWQKLDGTWNLSNHEWARKVYENDIKHLNEATMVVALYTGHYCSSGSIWEIGYAVGRKIPVILYIPEWVKEDMSLMVLNGANGILIKEGKIIPITEEYLSQFNQK